MRMDNSRITGIIVLIVATLIECTPLLNGELPAQAQDQDNWTLGVLISVSFTIISIGILVFCAGAGIRCFRFRNIKIFERRKRDYEAPNSYQQGNHLNNTLSPNNVQALELYPVIFEPLPILPKINPVNEKDHQEPSSVILSASTSPPTDVNHVQKTEDSAADLFFSLSSPHTSATTPLGFTTAVSCQSQSLSNDVLLNNNNNHIGIEQEKVLQTPKANHFLGIEINVIEPTPNVKINVIHATPNPSPVTPEPANHNRENHFQKELQDNSQPQPKLLRFKFDSPSEWEWDVDRRKRRTSTPIKTPSPTLITELEDVFEPKDSFGNVSTVSPIKSNSSFEDTNTLNSIMETSLIYEVTTDEETGNGAKLLHGGLKANPLFNGYYEYTSDDQEKVNESDLGTRSEFQLSKRVKRNLFLKEEDDGNGNGDEQHDSALYNSWNIVDSNKIEVTNDLNGAPCDTNSESDTNQTHSLSLNPDQIA